MVRNSAQWPGVYVPRAEKERSYRFRRGSGDTKQHRHKREDRYDICARRHMVAAKGHRQDDGRGVPVKRSSDSQGKPKPRSRLAASQRVPCPDGRWQAETDSFQYLPEFY